MDLKNYQIIITGVVQGVGFRYSARKMASHYGIKGYIKNLSDGSVFVEAEGSELQLQHFIQWCKKGPDGARVYDISVKEGKVIPHAEFTIRH